MPQMYIIAGPNGAGKTTSAKVLMPDILNCQEYVNADLIAADLSPITPEDAAIKAGRLMLDKIKFLSNCKMDFAFETTLASRTFINLIKSQKMCGYKVTILFLWLQSAELAISRVKSRVAAGGHNIPEDVIRRRYKRSYYNFVSLYSKIADNWFLYDNCGKQSILMAKHLEESMAYEELS